MEKEKKKKRINGPKYCVYTAADRRKARTKQKMSYDRTRSGYVPKRERFLIGVTGTTIPRVANAGRPNRYTVGVDGRY